MASVSMHYEPWPFHAEDEIQAVNRVLGSGRTNYWTGDEARAFEREYAASLGRPFAIALSNGTVALELALAALGVGSGDQVIAPARTFIGTASAAVMRGATPVLAEVDRDSGNLTAETIEPLITRHTKAIIPVHLGGWPVDMEPILALAREHGIAVIEDAAQAHGASIDGKPVGSFGHMAAFSFCQDKSITTGGEGGLLTMSAEDLWLSAWSFKDHGKSYDAIYNLPRAGNGYRYVYNSFGTNWRLTEVQAAIGRLQLAKLPGWLARRQAIAGAYHAAFANHPAVRVPVAPANMQHAYYRFYMYVRPEALRSDWNRDRLVDSINEAGAPALTGSASELYLERAFKDAGLGPRHRYPNAQELGETSIALMCHPTLSDNSVDRIIDTVQNVLDQALAAHGSAMAAGG